MNDRTDVGAASVPAADAGPSPAAPAGANPLLGLGPLPAFEAVRAEHVEPAVREMLATQRAALARAQRVRAPTLAWLRDLERINTAVYSVWGPVSHLNSVLSSPALRDAFNRCLPLVTEFGTELAQNEALYRHYGALEQQAPRERHPVEAQLIALALRDFRLGGVTLTGEPRRRYRELVLELAALQARFEQNLMDATDAFEHHERDRGALAGLAELTPERVIEFLRDLARRSRPVAARELAMLAEYAGRELDAWHVAFYSERMRQERLRLAEEELRPYFPLPQVLEGLIGVVARLFELTIAPARAPSVWHPTVLYYELRRRDGSLVGNLYADFFARPNKRGGAWLDGCVSRARLDGSLQTPIAYLTCNFNPPVGDAPSLLTHSEAVTLFHEFGHALHHVLTEVDYPSVAGLNGVAWDAVELPSQFLENFVWQPEVLAGLARHYRTGAPLAKDKLDTLQRSRTFLSGLAMVRQLDFALFDFRLHHEYAPERGTRVYETLAEVRDEGAVVRPPS